MLSFSGNELQSTDGLFVPTEDVNLAQSVFHFLSGTSIYRQIHPATPSSPATPISGGPIYTLYPKISLSMAFPYDLTNQNLPHLALEEGPAITLQDLTYGAPVKVRGKLFTVHGFAGSYQQPARNHWERTQLLGDIRQLFVESYIPVYDFSSGNSVTRIGTAETRILSAEHVSSSTPAAAEKFRFQVTFQAEY